MENLLYPKKLIEKLAIHESRKGSKEINTAPKFIFLCGQHIDIDNGGNRKLVRDFFKKNRKDVFCLYAEDLFTKHHKNEIDLLTYEHYLAELSDGIILFVESFGTACELGAFSMLESLAKKLLVINDIKHKSVESFINDGPVKKIGKELHDNVIFTNTEALLSNPLIDNKLRTFAATKKCTVNKDKDCINLRSFIIEVLDLICLLGPIAQKDLLYVYKALKGIPDFNFGDETNYKIKNIQIGYIFELLEKANLVRSHNGCYIINSSRYTFNSIMFKSTIKENYNTIRSMFLSRKFRYKEGIELCH